MQLLLDTHLLVWAMGSPQRLPAGLAEMLEDLLNTVPRQPPWPVNFIVGGHNTPVFSVASLWELVIKQALGRPDFNVQPTLLRRALLDGGWQELPIQAHHALAVASF